MLTQLQKDLDKLASPEKGKFLQRFFKTGEGEYAHGDVFLGIPVPRVRQVAREYRRLPLSQLDKLLKSRYHEYRLAALLILVDKFQQAFSSERKKLAQFYLAHTTQVNNWDLVDLSADKILGAYLWDQDKSVLYRLAKSENLWEKRIAIVATFHFIKLNYFIDTLKIAKLLLADKHDLIHKAVGWMLREVGKRDLEMEEQFLRQHAKQMPRTMLRYAIEKFPEKKRREYLRLSFIY